MQIRPVLAALRKQYGAVALPEPTDPFESIVWENVAYLVDDTRRSVAYENIKTLFGITPTTLSNANMHQLERAIERGGMQSAHRAAKVRKAAEIAMQYAGGDLRLTLSQISPEQRHTLLKRFPGIGDPGVDKILLFAEYSDGPALESNGLRVLERLGAIMGAPSYAATYARATMYLRSHGITGAAAREAFVLLRTHGRMLCKRTQPQCVTCPLVRSCAYGRL